MNGRTWPDDPSGRDHGPAQGPSRLAGLGAQRAVTAVSAAGYGSLSGRIWKSQSRVWSCQVPRPGGPGAHSGGPGLAGGPGTPSGGPGTPSGGPGLAGLGGSDVIWPGGTCGRCCSPCPGSSVGRLLGAGESDGWADSVLSCPGPVLPSWRVGSGSTGPPGPSDRPRNLYGVTDSTTLSNRTWAGSGSTPANPALPAPITAIATPARVARIARPRAVTFTGAAASARKKLRAELAAAPNPLPWGRWAGARYRVASYRSPGPGNTPDAIRSARVEVGGTGRAAAARRVRTTTASGASSPSTSPPSIRSAAASSIRPDADISSE